MLIACECCLYDFGYKFTYTLTALRMSRCNRFFTVDVGISEITDGLPVLLAPFERVSIAMYHCKPPVLLVDKFTRDSSTAVSPF